MTRHRQKLKQTRRKEKQSSIQTETTKGGTLRKKSLF